LEEEERLVTDVDTAVIVHFLRRVEHLMKFINKWKFIKCSQHPPLSIAAEIENELRDTLCSTVRKNGIYRARDWLNA
jgi:hypothetical protein